MMKITRIAVLGSLILFGTIVTLAAATQPKFRSSGSDPGLGRYLVRLAADADAEDLAATRVEIAALYGARLDPETPPGIREFAVTATAARARLLSSDPRVSEVTEAPAAQPAPSAPSPARHFTPRTTGYGDNGQSGTYTYDSSGNISAIGADTYLYDLEGRLKVSVTRGVEEDYTYDAFGNRKAATGATNCLGQTTCAQAVAVDTTTNRLQTINGNMVQYDAAGNIFDIAGTPTTHYAYDGTAMITRATVGSDDRQFVYTADDQRLAVKQGASWTWTVRDLNQKVLREFTSAETGSANFAMTSRAWLKDYVWRDGLLLAATTPNGTLHYHLDHLGTPRLITNMNRVKVAEHAHYPFGAEIDVAPHENPEEAMKFTGHERDIVAGDGHTLDYMHARFYSPTAGRFLSVDPGRYEPERPQSWNRYAYVSNNPITYNDPTGREQPFNTASYDWSGFLKGVDSVVSAVTQDYRDAKEAIAGMGTSASLSENVMGAAVLGIITANTAVGAIEPEERGGVQILKNVAQGKAAEVAVGTELKAEGKVILGSQVSAKTSEGRRVIDHLVQNGSGVSAVEVKSGNATRNAAQVAKDGAMAKDGATLVGKNAPAQLKGQTIKIETEVRRPNE